MKKPLSGALGLAAALALAACEPQTAQDEETAPVDEATPIASLPAPPVAAQRPHEVSHHGVTLTDPYNWLRDPDYPEVDDEDVLAYLKSENAYFEAAMAPHAALTEEIFEELKGRIKEDDSSVPLKDGDWLYQWRFETGAQYRKWYRTPVAGGKEQLILDEPALAEGKDYFRLGAMNVSPDGKLLAWSADTDGSEYFTVRVKNLETGEVLADEIPATIGEVVWAKDNATLIYAELMAERWRPYRIRAHKLGTPVADDPVLYEEPDLGFFAGVGITHSRDFIVIGSGDNVTTEVRVVPAADPLAAPTLLAARQPGHEYYADHADGRFFIRTNDEVADFRIVTAPEDAPARENWQELIGATPGQYLQGLTAFKDFIVVEERLNGLDQIRIRNHAGDEHRVEFPEAAYRASLGANAEFDVGEIRIDYESMVTPDTVFDYRLEDRQLTTRKVQEIPSGYDASQYATERVMASARDGALIPVSIVYRKDFAKGTGPVHQYGYGAYAYGLSPSFSSARLSLLDRGFAYAIAHVRGGDELGRQWYLDGKLEKRTNTFNDFVDVARFLVAEGWTTAGNVSASGGSAGGELMGAVINQAPEVWRGVVAHVPFVDVLNTMLDDTLPLTPLEWPEWGNPIEDKAAFDLIRSYSPYDNVEAKAYPPLLITGGLNDPRVTYWEPTKWAAKLRATKTDDNLLLLKTNMGAGHGGKSGRFESLREVAEEYVFLLMAFGRV